MYAIQLDLAKLHSVVANTINSQKDRVPDSYYSEYQIDIFLIFGAHN